MKMANLGFVPVLAVALLAGCAPAPFEPGEHEPTGESGDAIFGGTPVTGDDAVVAITWNGNTGCTGTLVAPDVVVTAAHCIHPDLVPFAYPSLVVFVGDEVGGTGDAIPVASGATHPEFVPLNDDNLFDVGLLRLIRAATVTPKPMIEDALDAGFVGQTIRLLGFGVASSGGGGAGIKREASGTVTELTDNQLTFENATAGTCNGDSGGPAFWTTGGVELFVGIHSLSDCATFGIDERIDLHQDFIADFIDAPARPSCEADGECVTECPRPDPDCPAATCTADGTCDQTCASDPDCDPCAGGGCGGSGGNGNGGSGAADDGGGDDATPPPAEEDDGGCSVQPRGTGRGSMAPFAALGLLAWARRRGRARHESALLR